VTRPRRATGLAALEVGGTSSPSADAIPDAGPGIKPDDIDRLRAEQQRTDFPGRDPSLDGVHLVIDGEGRLRRETWP
jgi:hypothetical protein